MNTKEHPTKEASNEDIIYGLISGMMDDIISHFSYKGMVVERRGDSAAIAPNGGDVKLTGGRYHLRKAEVSEVKAWLDEKAKLYGEEA